MKRPIAAYALIALGFVSGVASITMVNGGIKPPLAIASPARSLTVSGTTAESLAEIRNLDTAFANLSEYVAPAVVHIRTVNNAKADANGRRTPMMGGEGAGFIYRKDGYILTNDHVAGGYDKVTVILNDGRELEGKVIRAQDSDIAIVKVEAKDLPTLTLADSSKVRPGQFAIAFGTPFGLENSVTIGHVSAIGRMNSVPDMNDPNGSRLYPDLIQTDAAINRGNSGGPLVNIEGQVIGINTAIFTTNGASNGIGFTIPANQVRMIADILIRDGKLTRSMIGVVPANIKEYIRKERGLKGGAMVEELSPDGPAAKAGIQKGDVIIKIEDTEINSQLDLRNAMLKYRPETDVKITVIRGKETKQFTVKLEKFSQPAGRTFPNLPKMDDGLEGQDPMDMPDIREFFRGPNGIPKLQPQKPKSEDVVPPLGKGQARLGINVGELTDEMRKAYRVPKDTKGVLVTSVEPGSLAESVGLRAGDVVESIGEKKVGTMNELIEEVRKCKIGDRKSIRYSRFGEGTSVVVVKDVQFR